MSSPVQLLELHAEVSAVRRNFSNLHRPMVVKILLFPALPLYYLFYCLLWITEKAIEYRLYGVDRIRDYPVVLRRIIIAVAWLERLNLALIGEESTVSRVQKKKRLTPFWAWVVFEVVFTEVIISAGFWLFAGYSLINIIRW